MVISVTVTINLNHTVTTPKVCCRTTCGKLRKIKVQICDIFQTSCFMKGNISSDSSADSAIVDFTTVARNVRLLPAHMLKDAYTIHQLHCQWCSGPWRRAKHPTNASSLHQRCAAATDALAAGCHPLQSMSPLAIDRIEVGAIRRPQIWRNESGCWVFKKSHIFTVLLKDEEIAWQVAHHKQQLLWQEHVAVIAAIDLHPWDRQR